MKRKTATPFEDVMDSYENSRYLAPLTLEVGVSRVYLL
ncbi:hypothetical protein bpmyx0001_41760 [Bacillus pseudomycoides DSM 12442]|nr:hypothetical protein bpmyx0001_41760 [Bacillus pseudomycoides DSM 12442]